MQTRAVGDFELAIERVGQEGRDSLRIREAHWPGRAAPVLTTRPGQHPAHALPLALIFREHRAHLEQPDVGGFPTAAVRERVDKAGQQRRAQRRELFREGISEHHALVVARKRAGPFVLDERERDGFLEPRSTE